ncbi:hypothetical protein B7486_17235 [cyanobacterium TDX16]|nr:hypothetical protein B7486_17235 [cyanobacterium TDX16]
MRRESESTSHDARPPPAPTKSPELPVRAVPRPPAVPDLGPFAFARFAYWKDELLPIRQRDAAEPPA